MDTSTINRLQIKDNNLCNIDCIYKNSIIYPETDVTQVIANNSNNQNLNDWFDGDSNDASIHHGGTSDKANLKEWLDDNGYGGGESYVLPTADQDEKGGIKVAENVIINHILTPTYLKMEDDYLRVKKEDLNIPDSIAKFDTAGLVCLGNNVLLEPFADTEEVPAEVQTYPLRVDDAGHAGIAIPKEDFGNVQADWTEANNNDPSYIWNKPTIPTVNNSTITIQQGGTTKGNFTLNQNTNKIIVLDSTGNTIDRTYNIKVSDVVNVIEAVESDMEQFKKCFIELFSGEFEAIGNGKKTINVNLLGNFNFNNTYGEGQYNERDFLAAIIEVLGQLIYDNKTYFENYLHLNINVSFNIINPIANDTINISLADLIENSNLKEISYTGDYSATYDTIDEYKYVCLQYDAGKKHFFTIKYFNTAVRYNDSQLINDDYEYSTLLVQYTTSTGTNIL